MRVVILVVGLAVAGALWAEGPLDSRMESYRVIQKAGKEMIKPADEAAPGDVIEYRLVYTNTSEKPLSGLVITGPIPANTHYIGGSAHSDVSAEFTVSIDDGAQFESEPVTRLHTGPDGQQQEVVIPPSDYTQVRWQPEGSLQADQVQTFSYRVKVQ